MPPHVPKRPRRQASQERSRQLVAAILDGAAQVLLREGYARATTDRIAQRAGVSVGSVYQYFDDKDAIFEALIRRQTTALVEGITRYAPRAERPLEEELAGILRLALRLSPPGPELFRRLEQVPNAALRKAVGEGRHRLTKFVRDILELHRESLRVDDLDLAAHLIVSSAEGAGLNAEPKLFNERLAAELTAMFTRYLVDA
jgi:AcrR family transcriptional regulator